jgi:3-oxoadipate enol-lactonase
MDWIELNGVGLRYDLSGSGDETLVLVHEMGGTLESWDLVLPLLKTGTTILRYDTRGAGQSTKLRGTADIDAMTADVAALLDATGRTRPVTIMGGAVGGAITLRFAARYPERTRALLAFGPATGIPAERRPAVLDHADRLEREGMRAAADSDLARAYPEALRTDRRRFERYRARWLANDPGSYAAIYRMLAGLDMRDDLAAIRCPALVLAGTHDPLRPPATVEPIARTIPGARFEPAETGHYASTQTPELVAARIDAFLAEIASR